MSCSRVFYKEWCVKYLFGVQTDSSHVIAQVNDIKFISDYNGIIKK